MGRRSQVVGLRGMLIGVLLWLGVLLCAPLGAGCGDAPGADVPDSTMVAALTDLHLLDARRETFGDSTAGQLLALDSLRVTALAHHGLDTTVFEAALDALTAEPERLRQVYDSVIVRLNTASTALRQQDY
ncbi:MAG: DUF4296 domain-containing protein [Bacteroidota bacterium]